MKRKQFSGAGVMLAADVGGDPAAPPVILMHGGGQTRWSWGSVAEELVEDGHHVVSLDLRGHGESDWAPDGNYHLDAFVADLLEVIATLPQPPAIVGASLGGIIGLTAIGERDSAVASALILVDVSPTVDPNGTEAIISFMEAAPDGFASMEEAADAISAYLPHRPRPSVTDGLARNLRRRDDGRYRWHWDPRLIASIRREPIHDRRRLTAAARRLGTPTLLIRGGFSEIVTLEAVDEFRRLVPTSEYVEVTARHMVAGDSNASFSAVVRDFLRRHAP